jgi:hypothetical protein
MATLNETGTWPAGIYQLETTDPVLGGAPNEGTGAGMSNIPHQQLARRTQVLKALVDGAGVGATAVPLVTLNSAAARVTGSYRFASGDANTPATGVAGTVQVIAASSSAVNQTAWNSASTRMWTRFWNGTVWSAWSEIWCTTGASESLAANGWQRLPSGLILQWGKKAIGTVASATITFPIAFTTSVFSVVATADSASAVEVEAAHVTALTTTNFVLETTTTQGVPVLGTHGAWWNAIGR